MNKNLNDMINKSIKSTSFVFIVVILGGCTLLEKVKVLSPNEPIIKKSITEKKSISVICKRGEIKTYLDKGWIVVNKEENEVLCTWKTKKATKRCDLDLDKGCRITVPDKYGKEIIYSLERDKSI